jgi:16S rRNA (guanine966-N2)-methyltransferase
VIAGSARGRSLRAPRSSGVRPTADRVKEAMFDVLAALGVLGGADVLDLFAGSGALGIEALSRGAASVTFVESGRRALEAISANLERCGFAGQAGVRVVRCEALAFLARSQRRYDVALVDPPYGFAAWPALLDRLDARLAVLESSRPLDVPGRFEVHRTYRYGTTLLTVVTAPEAAGAEVGP